MCAKFSPVSRLFIIALFVSSMAALGAETKRSRSGEPFKRLQALIATDWAYQVAHSPMLARLADEKNGSDRWQDLSTEGLAIWQNHDERVLTDLQSIPRSRLSVAEQSTYDLFQSEAQARVEEFHRRMYLASFLSTEIRFWPTVTQALTFADRPFNSRQDYDDWLQRLKALPAFLDQNVALMRQGMKTRWTETKIETQRSADFIEAQRTAAVEDSALFKPFKQFPDAVPNADREQLVILAKEAITNRVQPALGRFGEFIKNEYLPAANDSPGLSYWPDGAELYGFLAKQATGTRLNIEQIRELGNQEVERIRHEMELLLPRIGHGTTLAQVSDWIRTEPELHCRTGDELLTSYRATAKRIDPTVVRLFKDLPRTPYGVEGIKAGRGLGGVYRHPKTANVPGIVVVDIAKPEIRPKNEIMAIMLHEGVPGHHLQFALDLERRSSSVADGPATTTPRSANDILRLSQSLSSRDMGFVEGWGLYAESLGDELELYTDPLDKFGELNLELTRAARVMVDTGIHSLGWDEDKATRYFTELTGKPISVATDEVEVVMANPGAQLGYTVGQLQFQALRSKATRELGSKFDVREFHNFVLQAGPVPFAFLERNLDHWISTIKKRKMDG
jgi:uncharacterized protein (DUF885 family)